MRFFFFFVAEIVASFFFFLRHMLNGFSFVFFNFFNVKDDGQIQLFLEGKFAVLGYRRAPVGERHTPRAS